MIRHTKWHEARLTEIGHPPRPDHSRLWITSATRPDPAESFPQYRGNYSLAAFGPATVADVQTWSGLTKLREVADRLRPQLRTYQDPAGTELFDVADAPLPDPDTPAPPRFLPEYDNVLFSYANRARVNPDGHQIQLAPGNGGRIGTVLIDGCYQANWRITVAGDTATLLIRPLARLSDSATQALTDEGTRLLAFAADSADRRDIAFVGPGTGTTQPGL